MIKKINQNEYFITDDNIFVRNFNKNIISVDANNLLDKKDYELVLQNEMLNSKLKLSNIDSESIIRRKIVIISDGYQFEQKHKILSFLSKDTTIISVNRSLSKWSLVGNCPENLKRAISFFVVNNPYKECSMYLPIKNKYFPKLIASTRTNNEFLLNYFGIKYLYSPVGDNSYSGPNFSSNYKIDDYRNSICAAIGLAYRFKVEKLILFCCDNSFDIPKDNSIKLENGLYSYIPPVISQRIIDANLMWLRKNEVEVYNYSSGIKLKNAKEISGEQVLEIMK